VELKLFLKKCAKKILDEKSGNFMVN